MTAMEAATPGPLDHAVREELGRILDSRGFANSKRLHRFLTYVVEQSLSGQAEDLKEYTIALEVFDRSPDYNPRVDAVVRVEARRLRQKLTEYYQTLGSDDPIRIELPTGSYVPVFRQVPGAAAVLPEVQPDPDVPVVQHAAPQRRNRFRAGAAIAAICGCLALLWWTVGRTGDRRRPEVVRLIRDAAASREPSVSPDGRLLAYSSDQAGNFDIWVRRLDSGDALQITRHEATDSEPDISPDGTQLVFRSERDGGGIYVVSTFGGKERLLIPGGRSPRFSPDGRSVAYWSGSLYFPTAQTFVVPVQGGTPRRVGSDVADARNPLWAPDGNTVLVQTQRPEANHDFNIASVNGSPARPTGWTEAVARAGLAGWRSKAAWDGVTLYFSALSSPRPSGPFTGVTQEPVNIWSIGLDASTGRVSGEPRQVTYGASFEPESAITPKRDLVFTSMQYRFIAASLRLSESETSAKPVFASAGSYLQPYVAGGGSAAIAVSDRSGQMDDWRKDFATGVEHAITATQAVERSPLLSADASLLFFGVREPEYAMYRMKIQGGTPEKICADCGMLTDVSADSRLVLFEKGPPYVAAVLNTLSGRSSTVATHPGGVYWARLSPDGKWIAFHAPLGGAHLALVVAPLKGESLIPQSAWIPLTRGESADWGPVWSANTNTVYFMSDRDGSRCLWQLAVDSRTKAPVGSPAPVRHLHRGAAHIPMGVDPTAFRLSVTPDRLFFTYTEATSSIYAAKLN